MVKKYFMLKIKDLGTYSFKYMYISYSMYIYIHTYV